MNSSPENSKGIQWNSREIGEIRELSRTFRGTQWNLVEFSGVLHGALHEFNGNSWGISGQCRVLRKIGDLRWFRAIWDLKRLGRKTPTTVRATTLQKRGVIFFSVFLCHRCREIWREILAKFSVRYVFQGSGVRSGKLHQTFTPKTVSKTEISRKFHSAGVWR